MLRAEEKGKAVYLAEWEDAIAQATVLFVSLTTREASYGRAFPMGKASIEGVFVNVLGLVVPCEC